VPAWRAACALAGPCVAGPGWARRGKEGGVGETPGTWGCGEGSPVVSPARCPACLRLLVFRLCRSRPQPRGPLGVGVSRERHRQTPAGGLRRQAGQRAQRGATMAARRVLRMFRYCAVSVHRWPCITTRTLTVSETKVSSTPSRMQLSCCQRPCHSARSKVRAQACPFPGSL